MNESMDPAKHVATGRIAGLAVNGESVDSLEMKLNGPKGDSHASAIYNATTPGYVGDGLSIGRHGEDKDVRWAGMTSPITSNHRAWTAMSTEEQQYAANALNVEEFPVGGALEDLVIENFPNFSAIPPSWELAFYREGVQRCRLLIREPNTPCTNAARALYRALHDDRAKMSAEFATQFKHALHLSRGLMGSVIYPGTLMVGDEVRLITPKRHPAAHVWWSKA